MPGRPKPPAPVEVDELKDAILRMIVREFGDRPLDVETAMMALSIAGFEIKQAAVFAPRSAEPKKRGKR